MNACPQAILCSAPASETHFHLSCVMEGLMEAVSTTKLSYHSEDRERGGEGRDGPVTQDCTSAALVCEVGCAHASHVWSALGALHSKLRLTVRTETEDGSIAASTHTHTHTPDCTLSATNIKTRTFLLSSFLINAFRSIFSPLQFGCASFLYVCPRLWPRLLSSAPTSLSPSLLGCMP